MMTTRLFHNSSAQLLAKASRKELLKAGPKKPANVYSLFVKDTFQSVKEEHPAASFGELSKLTNLKWKTLTEMQKKPYYDRAARLLKEYHSARAEFEKTLPAKKPASAYILYSNDVRPTVTAQNPSLKPTEIVKLISQKWRNLTETEKSKYNAIYQRHVNQWKAVNQAK